MYNKLQLQLILLTYNNTVFELLVLLCSWSKLVTVRDILIGKLRSMGRAF